MTTYVKKFFNCLFRVPGLIPLRILGRYANEYIYHTKILSWWRVPILDAFITITSQRNCMFTPVRPMRLRQLTESSKTITSIPERTRIWKHLGYRDHYLFSCLCPSIADIYKSNFRDFQCSWPKMGCSATLEVSPGLLSPSAPALDGPGLFQDSKPRPRALSRPRRSSVQPISWKSAVNVVAILYPDNYCLLQSRD